MPIAKGSGNIWRTARTLELGDFTVSRSRQVVSVMGWAWGLAMLAPLGCEKREYPFAYYDRGITFTGSRGIIHRVEWDSGAGGGGPLVQLLNEDGKDQRKARPQVPPSWCPIVVHLEQRDLANEEFSSRDSMQKLGGQVRNAYEASFEITSQRDGFSIVASYEGGQLVRVSVLVSSRESARKEISVDQKRIPLPLSPKELFRVAGEPQRYEVWPKAD